MAARSEASRRGLAYAVGLVALVCVVAPGLRPNPHDSFPLSNYPMFSYPRDRINELATAVGLTPDGAIERLSPTLISGGYEPVRAFAVVESAIAANDSESLCAEIAERVRRNPNKSSLRIQIVTEVHDTVAWFRSGGEPLARTVHAEC